MRRILLFSLIGVSVATIASAQAILTPSRTYSPHAIVPPPVGTTARPAGMENLMTGMQPLPKAELGYHQTPLKPFVSSQVAGKLATDANTTDADPLTLSDPGHGKMTDFYDPPANAPVQSIPGQKQDIFNQ